MIRTILFLLLTTNLNSQVWPTLFSCDTLFRYSGPPGQINEYEIECLPNDYYRIDFCTENVPDKLIVYINNSKTDSLLFCTGNNLTTFELKQKGYYKGYTELIYEDSLKLITTKGKTLPLDFVCGYDTYGGMLRLYFRVPDSLCVLRFKLLGNDFWGTVYDLCVNKIETGFISLRDTVYEKVCYSKKSVINYVNDSCKALLTIYENKEIVDTPIVINPSCLGFFDGSIEFKNYKKFNKTNLIEGLYSITISNEWCSKDFLIELQAEKLCTWYIPNVINPLSNNNIFVLFTKGQSEYFLEIYDRWGNLLHSQEHQTNLTGWNGYYNGQLVQPGVYVYVIKCLDKIFQGDLTIIY